MILSPSERSDVRAVPNIICFTDSTNIVHRGAVRRPVLRPPGHSLLDSAHWTARLIHFAYLSFCVCSIFVMDRLQQLFGGQLGGWGQGAPPMDQAVPDTAETTYISSLALLKMLKHGRAGVPMEVMGLMLGEFVDEYTVRCVDVFAMPQSGTGVSVEAVDPVFQTKMLDMLKQTNRWVFVYEH